MEMPEYNRHRIRTQLTKIIAHIHEARRQLVLCDDHFKTIRNADNIEGIATLQLELKELCEDVENIGTNLTNSISHFAKRIELLTEAMDNPNNTAPPIRGRFLALVDRTPLQRTLIREGRMDYSDLPTHAPQVPTNQNNVKRKCRRKLPDLTPKRKPRKSKRKDMPM